MAIGLLGYSSTRATARIGIPLLVVGLSATLDQLLETPTRQLLAHEVTVTTATHTEQKPLVLYAGLGLDGPWRVGQFEQPYSSEG